MRRMQSAFMGIGPVREFCVCQVVTDRIGACIGIGRFFGQFLAVENLHPVGVASDIQAACARTQV